MIAVRLRLEWEQTRIGFNAQSALVCSGMPLKFTVRVYKGDKYYIARVPELGITTQGATKEEARRNLREAIQTHLEVMADYAMEHGKVFSRVSSKVT